MKRREAYISISEVIIEEKCSTTLKIDISDASIAAKAQVISVR